MSERKMGEVFSLQPKLDKKLAEEAREFLNLGAAITIDYIINEYFKGGRGQAKLMEILEDKIINENDRQEVLDFISDLATADEDDKGEDLEAQGLDEEFDLVNILCEAIGKSKDEINNGLALRLAKKARQLESIRAQSKNKPAPVHKIGK